MEGSGSNPRDNKRYSSSLHSPQTDSGVHQASCTIRTGSFSRRYSDQGVALTTNLQSMSRVRMARATPLLHVCARTACDGVTFIQYRTSEDLLQTKEAQTWQISCCDSYLVFYVLHSPCLNLANVYRFCVRVGAVGLGIAPQVERSRVRFPVVSLESFIDIFLPSAL